MTPVNPPPPSNTSTFASGLGMGMGIALLISCLGSGVGFVVVKRALMEARKGWNLVPVVVAAVDVSEGTVVTFEMISQRSIPEQFVSSSIVKPDSASYIVNQKVLVPLQAGDPLLWSQFETKKQPMVLFAKSDLATGSRLAEDDVEERGIVPALVTPSWVHTEDRATALGKRLLAPFRKGDPIMWTHLEAHGAK